MEDRAMYQHILIATDGSALAQTAVTHGIALARAIKARVTAVTVTAPFHVFTAEPAMLEDTPASYRERMAKHTDRVLTGVVGAAKAAGVNCETVHVENEHAYQGIIDTARAKSCDLILMASHGRRGVSALLLGSETVKVLTHSKIPVLVHR
jgi:nucleotide-binding universal stress UspA family protein